MVSSPAYKRISKELQEEILAGKHDQDGILPSESKLRSRFGVSPCTIRNSLMTLKNIGLVNPIHGKGWKVTRPNLGEGLFANKRLALIAREKIDILQRACRSLRMRLEPCRGSLDIHFLSEFDLTDSLSSISNNMRDCVGAVILSDSRIKESVSVLLKQAKVPFVCAGLQEHCGYDTIATDNFVAGERITEHLIGEGHRQILYVSSEALISVVPSFRLRKAGYESAMLSKGLAPEFLFSDRNNWVAPGQANILIQKIESMKSSGNPPTCIISHTDHNAVQMLTVMVEAGVKVPEEISFAGIGGNFTDEDYMRYGLQCLRVTHAVEAWETVMDEAFEALRARVSEPDRAPRMILVAPSLEIGNSVLKIT